MKKFYVTMCAMLCGAAAMAQGFSAKSIENVKPGEKANLAVEVATPAPIKAFSFRLELPDGFKAPTAGNCELGRVTEECIEEELFLINRTKCADGNYQFAAALTDGEEFIGTEGVALILPITIGADVAEGVYTIKLYKGDLGLTPTDSYEAEIPVGVGCSTAINTINAADANAPIYNVAGQQVSKAQKGIFIQNGKKILK